MHGAQAGASEPRSCGTADPGRASTDFRTGLASAAVSAPPDPNAGSSVAAGYPGGPGQAPTDTCAWHPGPRLAPQQLVPLRGYVVVPLGHGAFGGSGGPLPAADLGRAYGHPYGGASLRPMCVNQRPLIANQQGPPTGVAGVHGSTGLGDEDGLPLRRYRLHPGQLLTATGMAVGTVGYGVAAGSGACGPVAAAGAAVRGAGNEPVEGAGANLQRVSPHAFRLGSARAGSPLGPPAEGMRCPQPQVAARWQLQGQDREDMRRADSQDEELLPDEEVSSDEGVPSEAEEGSDEEYVPPPKRRRLQGQASGTGAGLHPQEQQGVQPSVLGPQRGTAAERAPVGPAAAATASSQFCYTVRHCGYHLNLPGAVAHAFWPQLTARLKRSPGAVNSIQVTLHTCGGAPPPAVLAAGPAGMQQAVSGQQGASCDERCDELEEEEHAVHLSSVSVSKFRLLKAESVLAALGLRGEGVLQLRRTPDGRVWAEHAPTPAGTPCPVQLHHWVAAAQTWDVRIKRTSLLPPAATTRRLWPQQAAALKADLHPDHTVPVTLFTAACNRAPAAAAAKLSARTQQVGGGQGPAEQHTVLLHFTTEAKKFTLKEAAGVIAALGCEMGTRCAYVGRPAAESGQNRHCRLPPTRLSSSHTRPSRPPRTEPLPVPHPRSLPPTPQLQRCSSHIRVLPPPPPPQLPRRPLPTPPVSVTEALLPQLQSTTPSR